MSLSVTIYDETTSGQKSIPFALEFPEEIITVRELIRARIYEEVQDYNLKQPDYFHGLVQPQNAEQTLNGFKLRERRPLDWQEQYTKALQAFETNGYFVLIGEKQAERLDDEFKITPDTEISFIKLLPLVGG